VSGPSDLVLDASVAVKWYIPEELAAEARRFMAARFAIHVPSSFAAECGNTLWKKSAQRLELDRDRGREIFGEILAYPKRVHDAERLTALAYDLAHDVGNARLAIYDFIYLALAVALDCRLVTADRVFYNALMASPHGPRLLWVADPIPKEDATP
jgi:predicted nucleic acid-binding protein